MDHKMCKIDLLLNIINMATVRVYISAIFDRENPYYYDFEK
jgi:hypothetical protein